MSKDEFEFGEELAGMVSYSDETAPKKMPVLKAEPRFSSEPIPEKVVRVTKVEDASYTPVPNSERRLLDRLWNMTKWLGICGGICMLLWWFEANGLMVTEAARPCTFASGCIGFFGAGMNFRK